MRLQPIALSFSPLVVSGGFIPPVRANALSPPRSPRLSAAGQASAAISTDSARSVVPPGLVTARRNSAASSALAASSAPDPDTVCRASSRARSARNALLDRRLLHQFGQQEHIGRPAAGHRRHRIEQRLVLDPRHHADRLQQPSRTARAAAHRRRRPGRRPSRPAAPPPACSASPARSPPHRRAAPAIPPIVRPAMIDRNTALPGEARDTAATSPAAFCGLTANTTAAGAKSVRIAAASGTTVRSGPAHAAPPRARDRPRPTPPAPARASRPASRRPCGRSRPAGSGELMRSRTADLVG